jgi:quinolinate synthase
MKRITLPKVLWSLENLEHKITVPPDIARRAKGAIDRMVAIS